MWPCIAYMITRCADSVGLSVQEKKFNVDFKMASGGHLGFPIGTFVIYFLSTDHIDTSNGDSSQ